jgi:GntR family transcriptional repressor for pyruvate dehydrogenase complex
MPFKKIESRNKSAYAAEQLIGAIKDGTYKKGSKLPPERVLAERMGISRPLIREALSALQIAGIIESRAGDGTYIRRSIGNAEIETQVLAMLEEEEDPIRVFEARIILEEGTAHLAADRISEEQLESIEQIIDREKLAGEKEEYEIYVQADRDFHLGIVAYSRNPFLEAAIQPLVDIMGRRLWGGIDQLYLFNPKGISQTLEEHKCILDALKKRDAHGARKAMRRHLENARDRFLGTSTGLRELSDG